MSKHVVLVGKGKMGHVFYQALTGDAVVVLERHSDYTTVDWATMHTVVLAVKPQDFLEVAERLNKAAAHCLIVSVMAGVTTTQLSEQTGSGRIIRCMPNTPSQIGLGMVAFCTTPAVTADDTVWFKGIAERCGTSLHVENDDWIDKVTAISGSGPAYIFAMAEALVAAAKNLGFNEADATQLVQQTMHGSIALWKQSNTSPTELREQVTSKGGTTAAALAVLDQAKFMELWQAAVDAAYARTKTL